jgi:hypothetical protein
MLARDISLSERTPERDALIETFTKIFKEDLTNSVALEAALPAEVQEATNRQEIPPPILLKFPLLISLLRHILPQKIKLRAAISHNTPLRVLLRLSTDKNSQIRMKLASNTICPPEVFYNLQGDPFLGVRYAMALNPSCPQDILRTLYETNENPIVSILARNIACNLSLLEAIADSPYGYRTDIKYSLYITLRHKFLLENRGDIAKLSFQARYFLITLFFDPSISVPELFMLSKLAYSS